jgi:hypothetical protein
MLSQLPYYDFYRQASLIQAPPLGDSYSIVSLWLVQTCFSLHDKSYGADVDSHVYCFFLILVLVKLINDCIWVS